MNSNPTIILIDPLHGGYGYVDFVKNLNFNILAIFTMPKSFLLMNKYIAIDKISYFERCLFSVSASDIGNYIKKYKLGVIGVIPCTEPGVILAAEIAAYLQLLGNPIDVAKSCRNKWLMRQALGKHGLNKPDVVICREKKDAKAFLSRNTFPVVIKTPSGAGTDKVYLCEDENSLDTYMQIILKQPDLFGNLPEYALLESYITGDEYFVDIFVDMNGYHITGIWKYKKFNHYESKFVYSDIILMPLDHFPKEIIDYIFAAVKALGIVRGSVHVELKVESNRQATIIEIGARIPGLLVPSLILKSSNFNPYLENIRVFIQKNYRLQKNIIFYKHCHVVCIPITEYGRIVNIGGLDKIKQLASYFHHDTGLKYDDIIEPTKNLQDLALIVYLSNKCEIKLAEDVHAVRSLFKLKIDKSHKNNRMCWLSEA